MIELTPNLATKYERAEKSILLKGKVLEVNESLAEAVNLADWLGKKGDSIEVPFRAPIIPRYQRIIPTYSLKTQPLFHNRSVLVGRDQKGPYPFVNIKGMGYVRHVDDVFASMTDVEKNASELADKVAWYFGGEVNLGIVAETAARSEMKNSETLNALGVAGSRVVALVAVDELPFEREDGTYELRPATESGMQPVEVIRAMSCEHRIRDMSSFAEDPSTSKEELLRMFTKDVGTFENAFQYAMWFASTLARNIAIMHNAHLTHNFPTDHNTLTNATFTDNADISSFDKSLFPSAPNKENVDFGELTPEELTDL